MYDIFTIQVDYKGEPREFHGELRQFGYSYRIVIEINETEVFFEPDEERNFRAILQNPEKTNSIDPKLIQLITEQLEEALK